MRVTLAIFILLISAFQSFAAQLNWKGLFDGRDDPRWIISSGDNILTIEQAYVYDNGEGKKPDGSGSDCSWYGLCHGPYGNLHVGVYAPDQFTELHWTRLHGPHQMGKHKWEWVDDEGLDYVRYGIYDWDSHDYDSVWITIFEMDPGPWRPNDELISFTVSRDESRQGALRSSSHMPILRLRTVNLTDDSPKK